MEMPGPTRVEVRRTHRNAGTPRGPFEDCANVNRRRWRTTKMRI